MFPHMRQGRLPSRYYVVRSSGMKMPGDVFRICMLRLFTVGHVARVFVVMTQRMLARKSFARSRLKLLTIGRTVAGGSERGCGALRITKSGFKVFARNFENAVGEDEHSINVRCEPLQASEFQQRIGSKTATPDSDLDRRMAEWILENHGWVQVQVDGKFSPQMAKSLERLPNEQFTLIMAHLDEQATSGTNEDMKRFAGLKNLTWLNLIGIPISDDGIQHVSACHSLEVLDLTGTQVTDQALELLKEMSRLNCTLGDRPLADAAAGIGLGDRNGPPRCCELLTTSPQRESQGWRNVSGHRTGHNRDSRRIRRPGPRSGNGSHAAIRDAAGRLGLACLWPEL